MTVHRDLIFWTIVLIAIVFLLWLLSDILLPFVAGITLAYLQAPLADWLERRGMKRTPAAFLIVSAAVLAIIFLALLLLPILSDQAHALVASLPGYITRLKELLAHSEWPWLDPIVGQDSSKTLSAIATQGTGYLAGFLQSLWSGGKAVVSFISLIVIMPVVTFYLICDWHQMIKTLDGWVPRQSCRPVHQIVEEIDAAISGFVRGQAGICLILSVYYAIALSLTGLNFALLIGLLAGLLSFLPFVGSTLGLFIGSSVAVGQFWPDWGPIAVVTAVFLIGQFIGGYVLSPVLVGDHVGLHPVWLIFATLAFGYLFGFVGLLVAVPLGAAIAVLFRFSLRYYLDSPLYRGEQSH